MALTAKTLDRICLTVLVIVVFVCGYWVLNWGFKQQRLIQQENELLAKKLDDLNLAETNLQRLKTVLDSTRQELKVLNERIPDAAKIGEFLKQVDALMEERELDLISLHPQAAVPERHCTRIPIRLIFRGSFVKIYQVLHELETMNRLVVMGNMKITKSNKDQICRVDLTASIFERH